jgi:hypothetical protein
MTEVNVSALLAQFDRAIAEDAGPDAPYAALQRFSEALVGVRLFTVMSTDLEAGLARRAFTSDPVAYPASGVKPIRPDAWFALISEQRQPFVANSIEDIAAVFPDHELIASLGCGSVVNLPVFVGNSLMGTINILHEEGYYTPERVSRFVAHANLPAKLAMLAAGRR